MSTTNHERPKPGSPGHTSDDHAQIDQATFSAFPPPARGAFLTYDFEDGAPPVTLEYRNCICGSTLSREVNGG